MDGRRDLQQRLANRSNWFGRRVGASFDEVAIFGAERTVSHRPNVGAPINLGALEFRTHVSSSSTAFTFEGLGRLVIDNE